MLFSKSNYIQSSAKRCFLGCVNFLQLHLLPNLLRCILENSHILSMDPSKLWGKAASVNRRTLNLKLTLKLTKKNDATAAVPR